MGFWSKSNIHSIFEATEIYVNKTTRFNAFHQTIIINTVMEQNNASNETINLLYLKKSYSKEIRKPFCDKSQPAIYSFIMLNFLLKSDHFF